MADVNYNLFEEWSPAQAWWWGVFLGDGNSYDGVNNGNYDVNLTGSLSTVSRWVALVAPGVSICPSSACKADRFQAHIYNKDFLYWLSDTFGVLGPKTHSIKWVEEVPADLVVHFLRGLWDSDGSIYYSKRDTYDREFKTKYSSVVKSMVERVRDEVCARVDVPDNKVVEEQRVNEETGKVYTWYVVSWGGQSAIQVIAFLYKNSPELLRNEDRYDMYKTFMEDDGVRKSRVCVCGNPAARYGMCQPCWYDKKGRKVNIQAVCVECGDSKKILGRGLCSACYSRLRRAGKLKKKAKAVSCVCGKPAKYRDNTCRTCYGKMRAQERISEGFQPSAST